MQQKQEWCKHYTQYDTKALNGKDHINNQFKKKKKRKPAKSIPKPTKMKLEAKDIKFQPEQYSKWQIFLFACKYGDLKDWRE